MSFTPREIGTLIVVILRARHLPNKRHIGKQDPYCTVQYNGEKRRTKAIKRGGQHPEWDEEVRFTLYEDIEDAINRAAAENSNAPTPPPKDGERRRPKIKGGQTMLLCCYADDPREPDLIGEARVDLTEVLTKGETDEWFPLSYKDRYSGDVYLELTFWSNEPAPERKPKPSAPKSNGLYGGTGEFVPAGGLKAPGEPRQPSRVPSATITKRQPSAAFPPSMQGHPSGSNLDLYVAPYEQRASPVDQLAQEFGQVSVNGFRGRTESLPPTPPSNDYGYPPNPHYSLVPPQNHGYDRPLTPPYDQGHQAPMQPQVTGYSTQRRNHGRYSLPTASSGFMPLPSASSGFMPLSSHPSNGSGFAPPPSATPMGAPYMTPPMASGFAPGPSPTPSPHVAANTLHQRLPLPQPPSMFQQLPPPPPPPQSATMAYAQQHQPYPPPPPPPISAPPQQYPPPTPVNVPPPSQSAPPQPPYHQVVPYEPNHPPHHSQSLPPLSMPAPSSRPLPQPNANPSPLRQNSLPMPSSSNGPVSSSAFGPSSTNSYMPPSSMFSPSAPYLPPPPQNMIPTTPIPPPPPIQHTTGGSPGPLYDTRPGGYPALPAPPAPPISQMHTGGSSARPALPQPPVGYTQSNLPQPPYSSVPPPPPLPAPPSGYGYGAPPPPRPGTAWAPQPPLAQGNSY